MRLTIGRQISIIALSQNMQKSVSVGEVSNFYITHFFCIYYISNKI